jgi:RHS repeat-associated protein
MSIYFPKDSVNLRARYYNPGMGRFLTRDTWQGNENSPMSYNAWLYAYADPIRYVDPRGRFASEYLKFTYDDSPLSKYPDDATHWDDSSEQALDRSAQAVGQALANTINSILVPKYRSIPYIDFPWLRSFSRPVSPLEAFKQVYGGRIELLRKAVENPGVWAYTQGSRLIWIYTNATAADLSNPVYSRFLAHELGHAFEAAVNGMPSLGGNYVRNFLHGDECYNPFGSGGLQPIPPNLRDNRNGLRVNAYNVENGYWQFNSSTATFEVFADMFLAWVYDNPSGQRGWATQANGQLTRDAEDRSNVMNTDMPILIDVARWRWYREGRWR